VTAVREAVTLPLTFLAVLWLGGLRPGAPVAYTLPSLFSLVLASLMVGVFVQSGTLAPARLLHETRSALANLNGVSVVVALFGATAQVISMLTPATGLPAVGAGLLFLVAILQLLAAALDRARLLRVWAVTLLAAFTLKYVVLSALSGPAERPLARALRALFEGLTLGAVSQPVEPVSSGYLAFVTLALYLVGLVLLPGLQRTALVARH
jgi:hypothetical protein